MKGPCCVMGEYSNVDRRGFGVLGVGDYETGQFEVSMAAYCRSRLEGEQSSKMAYAVEWAVQ